MSKRKAEEALEEDLGSVTAAVLSAFAETEGVFNLNATDWKPIPECGPANQEKLKAAGIETPPQLLGKFLQLGKVEFANWCAAPAVEREGRMGRARGPERQALRSRRESAHVGCCHYRSHSPRLPRLLTSAEVGNTDKSHGESKRNKKYAALVEAWYVANVG